MKIDCEQCHQDKGNRGDIVSREVSPMRFFRLIMPCVGSLSAVAQVTRTVPKVEEEQRPLGFYNECEQ